jgi:hypothetical protein
LSKRDRFILIAVGSSLVLGVAHVYLKVVMEPFMRYLVYFLLAKVVSDAFYYLLSPRRFVWAYPEDYLFNEVCPLLMYGFPACIGQRYAIVYQVLPFEPVTALLDSFAPVLALCIYTRWNQETTDDRGYRPGRRLER